MINLRINDLITQDLRVGNHVCELQLMLDDFAQLLVLCPAPSAFLRPLPGLVHETIKITIFGAGRSPAAYKRLLRLLTHVLIPRSPVPAQTPVRHAHYLDHSTVLARHRIACLELPNRSLPQLDVWSLFRGFQRRARSLGDRGWRLLCQRSRRVSCEFVPDQCMTNGGLDSTCGTSSAAPLSLAVSGIASATDSLNVAGAEADALLTKSSEGQPCVEPQAVPGPPVLESAEDLASETPEWQNDGVPFLGSPACRPACWQLADQAPSCGPRAWMHEDVTLGSESHRVSDCTTATAEGEPPAQRQALEGNMYRLYQRSSTFAGGRLNLEASRVFNAYLSSGLASVILSRSAYLVSLLFDITTLSPLSDATLRPRQSSDPGGLLKTSRPVVTALNCALVLLSSCDCNFCHNRLRFCPAI